MSRHDHGGGRGSRRVGVFRERRARYLPRNSAGQRRSSGGGILVGIILLIVLGVILWFFLSRGNSSSTTTAVFVAGVLLRRLRPIGTERPAGPSRRTIFLRRRGVLELRGSAHAG